MADPDLEQMFSENVQECLREDIQSALRRLLEQKTLYQNVAIEWTTVNKNAEAKQNRFKDRSELLEIGSERIWSYDLAAYLKKRSQKYIERAWNLIPELHTAKERYTPHEWEVIAPPAEIYCRRCKSVKAHNSGSLGISVIRIPYPLGVPSEQVFNCGYECQSCRTTPVVFQITRRGEKLILTGSSEYPHVAVNREYPENIHEFISDAKIAYSTGRILAALFFLRTAIEQHMRKVTRMAGKHTGDEIAAKYRNFLNDDFPKKDWVLSRLYEELSEKLHAADPDTKTFEKAMGDLDRYFKVISLYPLKSDAS